MLIWLICPYGPIPGEGWRDYRYTMMGEALAAAGHDVVWWTSSFSHHFKRSRAADWEDRPVRDGFRIRLVPAHGYKKNVGLGRVWHELSFVQHVGKRAAAEPHPDCIIAVDPPQTVGWLAVRLARRLHCPLVFDVMDLWPEQFALALPARLRSLAPAIFSPFVAMRASHYRRADGLIALCESYLAVATGQLSEKSSLPTATIFNGVDVAAFRARMREPLSACLEFPLRRPGVARAIYAGTLGENYDILTLMRTAEILKKRAHPIEILVAGVGPLRERLEAFIRNKELRNLVYLGPVPADQLPALYHCCDVGIAAYGPESTVGMPDKIYDYLAAGLPVVNSLRRDVADLVEARGCGLQYAAGNPDSMANALETLAQDPELRRKMAEYSFAASGEFDRHVQYGKLPSLVERACQRRDGQGCGQRLAPTF